MYLSTTFKCNFDVVYLSISISVSAPLYFQSKTFWRQLLYFLLHNIYLLTFATSYFADSDY